MDIDWTTITLIAEANAGIVRRADLTAAGLSDRTIRRLLGDRRLVRAGRGVYRLGGVRPSFDAEVLAAIAVYGQDTWAARHTAARIHDLGLHGRENRIELLRPIELSAQRSIAVVHRSRTIPPHHLTVVRTIPVTAAPRTIFDVAATTGPVQLGRAIDRGLLARSCTMGSLYQVLYDLGGRGQPGTRRMRAVLDGKGRDHVPPESELEAVGMALLAGLGFDWQVEMSDEQGYIRRVDGRHAPSRLVVEFDGRQHDLEEQRALDDAHDARLDVAGWAVERLRWDDVTRLGDETRARIAAHVRRAAA